MYTVNDLISLGIQVKQVRGEEVLAICPFHDDHTPSLSLNLKKGVFCCFACNESGKFSKLGLSRDEFVTFDSFRDLLSGIDKTETLILKQLFSLPREFRKFDGDINNPFHQYLLDRGIIQKTIEHFNIGYCDSGFYRGRIIVPLPMGFVARSIYSDAISKKVFGVNYKRYLFPLGLPISTFFFNYSPSLNTPILVEGVFDALRVYSLGFTSVISPFSCKVSEEQIKLLCKYSSSVIYVFFDDDEAGRAGAQMAEEKLKGIFKIVKIVKISDGRDPGNLKNKNEIKELLRNASVSSCENEDYENLKNLIAI
jgi:DNA primase